MTVNAARGNGKITNRWNRQKRQGHQRELWRVMFLTLSSDTYEACTSRHVDMQVHTI